MKRYALTACLSIACCLCVFFFSPTVSANGTPGGKTITTSIYSYNDGDVSIYARVNGRYSGVDGTSSSISTKYANYQHTFDVVLVNNTNEFQVASSNAIVLQLYSGSSTTFAATASGEGSYHGGWGASVDSFSDNMSAPEIIFHKTGEYAGNVFIRFTDSDLLVLNPNETRTYTFTINFTQDIDINYTYPNGNGNYMYSYFTYAGNVSFYAKPESFTSQTVEDFISNGSLPNSVIAYLDAQYSLLEGSVSSEDTSYTGFGTLDLHTYNSTSNNVQTRNVRLCLYPYLVDYSAVSTINDESFNYVFCMPVYWYSSFLNQNDYRVRSSTDYFTLLSYFTLPDNVRLLGTDIVFTQGDYTFTEVQLSGGQFNPTYWWNGSKYLTLEPNQKVSGATLFHLYFGVSSDVPLTSIVPNFSFGNVNFKVRPNFSEYSTSTEDDLSDIHDQEQQYFSDTNTAIGDTGLESYQFDQDTSSGMHGIKDDFTSVWNACGSLTNVWIFSLTFSVALSIIRHVRLKHF